MLGRLRDRLSPRDQALFKLVCWVLAIVWSVFWFALGLVFAQRLGSMGPVWFGTHTWGKVMTWVAPVWLVFTVLLTLVTLFRWIGRKLGKKN